MEEWEYIEGHKELYKDLIMEEEHQSCTSPGRLHDDVSSHQEVSRSSGRTPRSSCSRLRNELKKTGKDEVSCDGGSLKSMSDYVSVDREEYLFDMEEQNLNMYTSADDGRLYPSAHILDGPVSCDGENFTESDIYTQHPTTCIKEEPLSGDEDLLEPTRYTAIDYIQYPSPHIKEESLSSDEDLTEHNSYPPIDRIKVTLNSFTPTDHVHFASPHIKEEPLTCDEHLAEPNSYVPIDHIPYLSPHIKEEPASYDEGYSPAGHTQQHQYAYIKQEPDSDNGESVTHADMYTPREHAQYQCTNIKEEPVSCGGGNIPYLKSYPPAYHAEQYPAACEPGSPDGRDFTGLENYTQYPSSSIKEEPGSGQDDAKYPFAQRQQEPITISAFFKETDLFNATDHAKSFPSTCVKDAVQHSPTSGHNDVKTKGSSSPLKVIVLAHLVDVDNPKPHCTNNKGDNSPSQKCVASTSNHVQLLQTSTSRPPSARTPESGETFGDISNLTKYLRTHSRKKTPQCPECGQYFLRKFQLDAHLKIHAKQRSLQGSGRGKHFRNNIQPLDRKKQLEDTKYQCSTSGKRFSGEPDVLTQEKSHKREKPFQCPECGKCFSIYYQLFVHKKTHKKDSKGQGSPESTVQPETPQPDNAGTGTQ